MKKLSVGRYSNKKKQLISEKPLLRESTARKSIFSRNSTKTPLISSRNTSTVTTTTPVSKGKRKWLRLKYFLVVILLIGVGVAGFGYYRIQVISSRIGNSGIEGLFQPDNPCPKKDLFNPKCWTEAFKPQLKQTDGFTNALIIGLDTREGSSSLKNTDSIILASFNHSTQKTMLISIPRDFYVKEYGTKINAVYAFTYTKNPDDEYFYLKEMVTKITGKPIHYFATVRFEGVIDGINKIGGVQVCPEKAFTAKYPNDKPKAGESHWLYYDFSAGCQTVDGEKALVYARFRYVSKGPQELASDFSRARRQQEVIEAVKDTLLSQDISVKERADNYTALLNTFQDNVKVDITLEDIWAGLTFIDTADRDPINVVLDPNFVSLNRYIYTESQGTYYIKAKDSSYGQIQQALNEIWQYPEFFKDQPKIQVANATGAVLPAEHPVSKLKSEVKFYYFFDFNNSAKATGLYGIKIFDFSNGEKKASIDYVVKYLGLSGVEVLPAEQYGLKRSTKKEDFLIAIGPPEPTPTPISTTTVLTTP